MVSKHVYGPLVILVRILPVLLSMPERGDLCKPSGVPDSGLSVSYVIHNNETTRESRCCKMVLCIAGQEVVYCEKHNSSTTSCRKCPYGTYSADTQMSHMNPSCKPWTECNDKLGEVANDDGTDIKDRTCSCDISRGFYSGMFGCKQAQELCKPDEELNLQGNCESCREGMEQPVVGYGPCKRCPIHHHKEVGKLRCSPCDKGTYKPRGAGGCFTCSELRRKNIHTMECEWGNGTVTIKTLPSSDQEDGTVSVAMVVALGVLGFLFLVVAIIVATMVVYKRRKENKPQASPSKKPLPRSPKHLQNSQNYTPVPDDSSRSSAEDAMDNLKAKDQNMTNTVIQNINEKSIPGAQSPPARDGQSNEGYKDHGGGMPNGGIPNGGMPNGGVAHPPHPHPDSKGSYYIYAAPNCAIIVGDHGTLHNQTLGGSVGPNGYVPNKHQGPAAAPPTNFAHHNMGQPDCDGVDSGPAGQYYEDPADHIAAQYGTPC